MICNLVIIIILPIPLLASAIIGLIKYGDVRPCVNPNHYTGFGGTLEDLPFDKDIGCHLKPALSSNSSLQYGDCHVRYHDRECDHEL